MKICMAAINLLRTNDARAMLTHRIVVCRNLRSNDACNMVKHAIATSSLLRSLNVFHIMKMWLNAFKMNWRHVLKW